ncbi:MAG TPA: phosphatase PAP2 family protein [Fibrobacteria bacterium]|nr:phosphatase PAP2 family protein [Fibrobacteria bacterium]
MDATELDPRSGESPRTLRGAFTSRVMAVDVACFRLLASLSVPKWVSLPLVLLVRIGDGYMWAGIAFCLWWVLPLSEVKSIVAHCLLAIAVSLCIYFPIKFGMKRLRPYDNGMDVTPLVPPLDKYSFPSGHTMNNLAVALTLAYHLPGVIVPAMLFPVTMGLLRILFGVHYLSDIVGGTLLGAAAFFIAKTVFPSFGP